MNGCPIPGCDRSVPGDKVMCGRHWKMVNRGTQRAVYRTWDARLKRDDEGAAEAHEEAKARAISEATQAAARWSS